MCISNPLFQVLDGQDRLVGCHKELEDYQSPGVVSFELPPSVTSFIQNYSSRYHVPPTLTGKSDSEIASGKRNRSTEELMKVMAEKRMALDLIGGLSSRSLSSMIYICIK
jgi:hypothetical protein